MNAGPVTDAPSLDDLSPDGGDGPERAARTGFAGVVRSDRGAALAFAGLVVAAFPLLLYWGRNHWFTVDDWDFLGSRTAGDLGDVFRSHWGHWVTLPVLMYRGWWRLFGLHYWPYQVLVISLHLVAAVLLRTVMRRAGVGPWLATLAAGLMIFFGYGAENILVAFQIAFVGSLVFGLAQLLLADHDGRFQRRDLFALGAGLLALLCSNVGLVMVAVVTAAVLLRRGWRMALVQAVPLAVVWLAWYATTGHGESHISTTPSFFVRFVAIGVATTFARLGQVPGAGVALFAVLVVGLGIALRRHELLGAHRERAAPFALLAGAFLLFAVTATSRSQPVTNTILGNTSFGPSHARQSRYIYLAVAMALPAIALAAQIIASRSRRAAIAVAVILVLGVPGNILAFSRDRAATTLGYSAEAQERILVIGELPILSQLPRATPAVPFGPTVGFLADASRSGRLPRVSVPPEERARIALQLVLRPVLFNKESGCRSLDDSTTVVVAKGQTILPLDSDISVQTTEDVSLPVRLKQSRSVRAIAGPLNLAITPLPGGAGASRVCIS